MFWGIKDGLGVCRLSQIHSYHNTIGMNWQGMQITHLSKAKQAAPHFWKWCQRDLPVEVERASRTKHDCHWETKEPLDCLQLIPCKEKPIKAEHWTKNNLTPGPFMEWDNDWHTHTHTHTKRETQLSIFWEKLEHRINGSTQCINEFLSENLFWKTNALALWSHTKWWIEYTHSGSSQSSYRQAQMHKCVPHRIQALKGNTMQAIMPIAQLNV